MKIYWGGLRISRSSPWQHEDEITYHEEAFPSTKMDVETHKDDISNEHYHLIWNYVDFL